MRPLSVSLCAALSLNVLLLTGCTSPASIPDLASTKQAASQEVTEHALAAAPLNLHTTVLERLPFDPALFVQGLEVDDQGDLLVGTGLNGESGLFRLTPGSSNPTEVAALNERYFGEGIAQATTTSGESVIWQLTWKAGEAFKYDATTFKQIGTATYSGEGWGLCAQDSQNLVMSDGTSTLRFLNPDTFSPQGSVLVTLNGNPVENINELECVNGDIYANVWMEDHIIRIDPHSGEVTAVIDTSAAANNAAKDPNNVLNGIAAIPGTDEFYITGKRWPDLYRVRFEPVN